MPNPLRSRPSWGSIVQLEHAQACRLQSRGPEVSVFEWLLGAGPCQTGRASGPPTPPKAQPLTISQTPLPRLTPAVF